MTQEQYEGDVGRIAARLARQVEIALATVDLSLAQYRVLYQLAEGTVASSSLAAQIAVSPPSITNVVEGLVQRTLVRREHSADDRRKVSLLLTPEGEAILRNAEFAIGDRLVSIAEEAADPSYTKKALSGLALWRRSLEIHRNTRLAEKSRRLKETVQ